MPEITRRFEISALETARGPEEITRDLPNVTEADIAHLDDAGLAKVGTAITPGMILIGKVTPFEERLTLEQRLYRPIFEVPVRDSSLRAPPGCSGVVIHARVEHGRAIVELVCER